MQFLYKSLLVIFIGLTPLVAISQAIDRLQEVYLSQVGIKEKTGHNDGVEVEAYLASAGLEAGEPWCASFVKWCLLKAGYAHAQKINGASGSVAKGLHVRLLDLRAGDNFVLYSKNLGRIDHTGFYNTKVNTKYYESVEGNWSNAVCKQRRSYKATHAFYRWTGS